MKIFSYLKNIGSAQSTKKLIRIVLIVVLVTILFLIVYSESVYFTFNPDNLNFLSDSIETSINNQNIKSHPISIENVSVYCKMSFISTEDKNFYSNIGVDFNGIVRLFITGISNQSDNSGGGSTITQQVIKLSDQAFYDRTIQTKLDEIIEAVKLNQEWSKTFILEKYLNNIYLGNYNYGIESASLDYFGQSASKLNLAECAYLSGLTQLPEVYNPYKNLDLGLARMKTILDLMLKNGFITHDQYQAAVNETLKFTLKK